MEPKDLQEMALDTFGFLVAEEHFVQGQVTGEENSFRTEFVSNEFCLRLETYRREIYPLLYRPDIPDSPLNLFVLLQHIAKDSAGTKEPNYFRDVRDIAQAFRLQMEWIARCLKEHIGAVRQFFGAAEFRKQMEELNEELVQRHPELFRKTQDHKVRRKSLGK